MTDFTCNFLHQVFSDGCGSRSRHSHISNIQLTMTSLPLHKMYISYSYSWSQNCLRKKLAVAVCLTICQFLGCHPLSTIKTSPEPCYLFDGELILCMYVNELVTMQHHNLYVATYIFIDSSTDTSLSGAEKQPSPSTCSPAGMITTGMYDVALF